MLLDHPTIRLAFDRAGFQPEFVEYWSLDRMILTGRPRNAPITFRRESGPRSRALWQSSDLKKWVWTRWGRSMPREATNFGIEIDKLVREQMTARANLRNSERSNATSGTD
jgi:hypothetical protein